ncbi:MAG: NFACT RNA binding domain-containing protein [Candidatus Gastranaerophilaceae bacterium]
MYLCLAIELMGKHSNVILYSYDTNMIIGCAHNVGAEKSKEREMAGGLPYIYPPGRPKNWYSNENSLSVECDDFNSKIDDYYAECIHNDKFKKIQDTYKQLITRRLKKDENSLKKMMYRLEKEFNADKYRLYGDLIMANLYNLKDYSKFVKVYDYENNKDITIELDETRTLKDNANKFYKLYNKGKTSVEKLTELTDNLRNSINYYEQILYSLEIASSVEDLFEITSEIETEKEKKSVKKSAVEPLELNIDGCKVFVGRNNRQNDYIVSKLSRDEDIWLHTKDCAGSHVLLRCDNPSDELILKCAELAKEYSKGKNSSKVGVIYTKRKYLKKPPAANLGYVTYKNEREIIL